MLKIRRAQIEVFHGDARRRFLERLGKHLRATCDDETSEIDSEQLLREVEEGIRHAARYEIETERDLRVFLECRTQHGAQFDTREKWAAAILGDGSLFPEEKTDLLSDRHLFAIGKSGPR